MCLAALSCFLRRCLLVLWVVLLLGCVSCICLSTSGTIAVVFGAIIVSSSAMISVSPVTADTSSVGNSKNVSSKEDFSERTDSTGSETDELDGTSSNPAVLAATRFLNFSKFRSTVSCGTGLETTSFSITKVSGVAKVSDVGSSILSVITSDSCCSSDKYESGKAIPSTFTISVSLWGAFSSARLGWSSLITSLRLSTRTSADCSAKRFTFNSSKSRKI
ncbi:Uncharacterised protein [Streptococcus suis]|nr:Uncharacterised protein [Streptococcus suis]